MNVGKDKTAWLVSSGPGLLVTLVIGAGLGVVFAGDMFNRPTHAMMTPIALGLVAALVLVQWLDLLAQSLSLAKDPVPADLNLDDRVAVSTHLSELKGSGLLVGRAARLLTSWASGGDARQVTELAAFQSEQAKTPLRTAAAFSLILLAGALWQGDHSVLAWAGVIGVAITLAARQNLLSRVDSYLETQLLSRLPGGSGGAQASGSVGEFTAALEKAFKQYMPQADKMSTALTEAVSQAGAKTAEQLHAAGGGWSEQIGGVLAQHADQVQSASQHLATQLDRIAALQTDIQKMLQVQETIDKTLKSVSTTEEFQATLSALRKHVEETDKVLREMAKPRKIRLVESPASQPASDAQPQLTTARK